MKFLYISLLLIVFSITAYAQKWNVESPPGPSKKITITTDEGTWMNLDVSHDGKTIVFDLLGDIYSIPVPAAKQRCWPAAKPGRYNRVLVLTIK
jgi:hypothetical protein